MRCIRTYRVAWKTLKIKGLAKSYWGDIQAPRGLFKTGGLAGPSWPQKFAPKLDKRTPVTMLPGNSYPGNHAARELVPR